LEGRSSLSENTGATTSTLNFEDVATLFHGILFAYQKATSDILGSGTAVFAHPILDIIRKISERTGINLVEGKDLDKVFENFARILPTSGVAKGVRFEKLADEKYVLHIDECAWARHIHSELKPEDVTCPLALLAMAVFEEITGKRVKLAHSKYMSDGTKTTITRL